MSARDYVVFDLDNCLSDDRHRIPLIDFSKTGDARWAAYHQRCGEDMPGNLKTFYDETVVKGRRPVFITMRPESVRDQTHQWIETHLSVKEGIVYMRPNGDRRPSVDLKRDAVQTVMSFGPVARAYDDREDIVAMYRQLGIDALQLFIHTLSATEPPAPAAGHDHVPLAPPTRGEGPPRSPPHPFTTDPIASLRKTTGRMAAHDVPPAPKNAGDFLRAAADTYAKKNAEYGDDYRHFGHVAAALFPGGLHVRTAADWNRLAVFIWALSKMGRYAKNMDTGGHADSALDLSVYGAMLREMTA